MAYCLLNILYRLYTMIRTDIGMTASGMIWIMVAPSQGLHLPFRIFWLEIEREAILWRTISES